MAAELLTDNLPIQSSETSVELNLVMFKLKHTVKWENDNDKPIDSHNFTRFKRINSM